LSRFLLLLGRNSEKIEIYEKIGETYKVRETFPIPYAVEKILANEIKEYTQENFPLFMSTDSADIYSISDRWAKIVLNLAKVLNKTDFLDEKLRFIEKIRFFTSLEEQDLEGLEKRLFTFVLGKKLEG